jgi:carboxypeptidase family protein
MTASRLARDVGIVLIGTAILGLFAPAAAAQPARPPAQPAQPMQAPAPAQGTGQISGVIKSATDDAPLGRARVTASAEVLPEPRVTISGADGKYTLTDLPPGSYIISVTRTGYAPQNYSTGRALAPTPIVLANAQQVAGANVALVPGGYVAGRIFDEDGTPFAGALVDALVTRSDNGTDVLVSVSTAETDDRGEFRLFGLAPGQYYVSAADPAFRAVSTPKGVLHYSPTYFPGVPFADQAKPIVLTGTGEPPRVEFRLKIVPPARVAGKLLTSDTRQLLSAAIILSPIEGQGVPVVPPEDPQLFPDGVFSFGRVVPGNYQLRARGQTDPAAASLFAVYAMQINGADVENIQITLRPGAVLDGYLVLENKRGTKPPSLPLIRVRAPFTDGNNFGDALTGTVQPDGTFALRGLMMGPHQLVVDGLPAPWVLKSVLYRGVDITDRQFDVAAREQFRDVRVTIADGAGEVTGVVENARNLPAPNTCVLIFPRAAIHWMRTNRRMRTAYTDREGRFTVPGLPPGEYLAVASIAADESDLGRRDRLVAWQRLATPFVLESDDSRASVKLSVVSQPPPGPLVR